MMRLRNRLSKAGFWTDSELLRWPRDKRFFYKGLWHLAEDSGCLENDPFSYKLILFPSPLDSDITVEDLSQHCDELVTAGKLIPYSADNKEYYFLRRFHRHQGIGNPGAPEVPLPEWITFTPSDNPHRGGTYEILPPYDEPTPSITKAGKGKESKSRESKLSKDTLQQPCASAVTVLSDSADSDGTSSLDKKERSANVRVTCGEQPDGLFPEVSNSNGGVKKNVAANPYVTEYAMVMEGYPRKAKSERERGFPNYIILRKAKLITPSEARQCVERYIRQVEEKHPDNDKVYRPWNFWAMAKKPEDKDGWYKLFLDDEPEDERGQLPDFYQPGESEA